MAIKVVGLQPPKNTRLKSARVRKEDPESTHSIAYAHEGVAQTNLVIPINFNKFVHLNMMLLETVVLIYARTYATHKVTEKLLR